MEQFEKPTHPLSQLELHENQTSYEVRGPAYCLTFDHDTPYITLSDANNRPWMSLFKGSSITTSETTDPTYQFELPQYEIYDDGSIAIRVRSYGEAAAVKDQTWICHDNYIETYLTTRTSGDLKEITLLGGTLIEPNMFGESVSERFFNGVYNPQPSEMERPVISALESTRITTSGMWRPGRRREFLITPFTYGFTMSSPEDETLAGSEWLMASVSSPIEKQNMIDFRYDVHEDGFSLKLGYDSTKIKEPVFISPSLLLHFAPNPLQGIKDAKNYAKELGHLAKITTPPSSSHWHKGTKFVTWGHQLEEERRQKEKGGVVRARDVVTESFITKALETFEDHDITIDTVVIDDKWQAEYGTNYPDTDKWPDLAHFTHTQHELGRHILLWMKLFDPEGLPPELCIRTGEGVPIASDPTNPEYLDLIREQVHTLLSPSSFNADGLKLDFIAQLPHGPGLRWHGNQRGPAALHMLMQTIHTEAISTKPDALIQAQIVNPWLGDSFNQVRLNDTNERHAVVRTMGSRAQLALALLPDHSIDPDGWPMPNREQWRTYIEAQPDITGAVTTHFIETLNGEPLTKKDIDILRKASRTTKNNQND